VSRSPSWRVEFLERLLLTGALRGDPNERLRQINRPPVTPIGSIAFSHGMLTGDEVEAILERQRETSEPFGQVALELNLLSEQQLDLLLQIQSLRGVVESAEAFVLSMTCSIDRVLPVLSEFIADRYPVGKD
jgi:hypothetical protein